MFQMHYATNGKAARDRTKIGLVFAKQPTTEQIVAKEAAAHWLAIPPNDPDYHTEAQQTIQETC